MSLLKQIPDKGAVIAWSPLRALPNCLATGTKVREAEGEQEPSQRERTQDTHNPLSPPPIRPSPSPLRRKAAAAASMITAGSSHCMRWTFPCPARGVTSSRGACADRTDARNRYPSLHHLARAWTVVVPPFRSPSLSLLTHTQRQDAHALLVLGLGPGDEPRLRRRGRRVARPHRGRHVRRRRLRVGRGRPPRG
jgi:hypothetical protein